MHKARGGKKDLGTGEVFRYWEQLHERIVPDLVKVWAIRFELAEGG